MKQQAKILLEKLILCAIAFTTLVTLTFPLLEITSGSIGISYTGISFLNFEYFKNGEIADLASFCGICSICQLLITFISIIMFFSHLANGENNSKSIISIGIIVSLLYLIEGVMLKETLTLKISPNGIMVDQIIETSCITPLIIQAILSIAYIVISNGLINTSIPSSQSCDSKTIENTINVNRVSMLKQYKELLDMGIITQEEFEKKKKEIL